MAKYKTLDDAMAHAPKKRGRRKVRGKSKVEKVMHEWKHGTLHSGSKKGPKVTSRRQAIAIAMSEQRKADRG